MRKGGEVGRDIFVWRDLENDVSEEYLDQEAYHMLQYEKELLRKHGLK